MSRPWPGPVGQADHILKEVAAMLLRYDPFQLFDRLERQLFAPVGGNGGTFGWMPMNAVRQGDVVEVTFDLPGIDPASVDATVEGNVLTVTAERTLDLPEDAAVLVRERPSGRFVRRLTLGEALDLDKLEAHYEHGVLTLVIPVAASAKPRRIEITAGGGKQAIEGTATKQG
jgi:HSP20 family protein